ncbi:hypothetical protein GDO81_023843 [Engystomops pustulosus]|uniref:Uncharacterized protein n=1 Tax=Engystomops pustulosus TaxID=76066 RepID=A0AAV6YUV8_ENGPU|nr:hypothetical protein GDO81_023843 [Engystomops pustulosus]
MGPLLVLSFRAKTGASALHVLEGVHVPLWSWRGLLYEYPLYTKGSLTVPLQCPHRGHPYGYKPLRLLLFIYRNPWERKAALYSLQPLDPGLTPPALVSLISSPHKSYRIQIKK